MCDDKEREEPPAPRPARQKSAARAASDAGPDYADLAGESAYSARMAHIEEIEQGEALAAGDDDDASGHHDPQRHSREEGLSTFPEKLGRVFLEDATTARVVVADDQDDQTDVWPSEEIVEEEQSGTDRDRKNATLPPLQDGVESDRYPAFDAEPVREVVRDNEGLYMRWVAARNRGEVGDVEVNGHRYCVVRDSDLVERILQTAPNLEGYLFDASDRQLIVESSFG